MFLNSYQEEGVIINLKFFFKEITSLALPVKKLSHAKWELVFKKCIQPWFKFMLDLQGWILSMNWLMCPETGCAEHKWSIWLTHSNICGLSEVNSKDLWYSASLPQPARLVALLCAWCRLLLLLFLHIFVRCKGLRWMATAIRGQSRECRALASFSKQWQPSSS